MAKKIATVTITDGVGNTFAEFPHDMLDHVYVQVNGEEIGALHIVSTRDGFEGYFAPTLPEGE